MSLLSYDAALTALREGVAPRDPECVGLLDAAGRVLAEEITAPRAQPPQPLSAMDGYAVRSADVRSPNSNLRVIGESAAGTAFEGDVSSGEAVRIFTGGTVPEGADRIVIQEDVQREGDQIHIREAQTGPHYVRPAGLDFDAGQVVLKAGARLTAIDVALAAAANCGEVSVYPLPRVGVFASGDELVEPGAPLSGDRLINSGAYGLLTLIREWGGEPHYLGILPDDRAQTRDRIAHAIDQGFDLLVTIGGASVGDYDVLRPAIGDLGANLVFEKVAVRPGKPTWHARFEDGPLLLGLPGNPASALVCAHLFLKSLLSVMSGGAGTHKVWMEGVAAEPIPENGQRESFLRGFGAFKDGALSVTADARQDSSLLTPFAAANLLIRRAPNAEVVSVGDTVKILPLAHQTWMG